MYETEGAPSIGTFILPYTEHMENKRINLIPEERDLADSLAQIANKYGKLNADDTGIWAGYTSAEENYELAAINVKCGSCVFFQGPGNCQVVEAEIEEGGLCRLAIIPDGVVTAAAGSKPAPKKDQIKGSSKNKEGSASSGKSVNFSAAITKSLETKVKEHNEKAANGRRVTLAKLKAVYRRGAGAFSGSYRPGQNRNSWAMGRVNAFLLLVRTGKPKNAKYTTDNDLLPRMHPRSTASVSRSPLLASLMQSYDVVDQEDYPDDLLEPWLS